MLVPETEIIISRDGAELARTTVRPGDYLIGSHAAAEINIAAEGVAERHAQLTVNYSELFIEDLGSSTGTFVGGQRVTESVRLWPSQKVQIGSVVLETRKVKSVVDPNVSLAPDAATVRRVLPEEFLRARKYEIGGLIAQGGMGAVLDALEATTQRTVAMKVMLSHMSEGDVLRFIEEAQITSQLEHPNIVPVHELGVDEHDQVFYTMKLVQGVTLRQVLEKLRAGDAATVAAYPLRRLLIVMMRVCDAMAFAHSKGVIHRDLKPDNVMIGDFGEVLVMDWGLAKVLGGERAVAAPASASDSAVRRLASLSGSVRSVRQGETASFTMAGSIVGTPHYMSPEQANGETDSLDEGSDIWALGAILRHILTLQKPVLGETVDEVIENVREGRLTPIPPRAAHCPGGRVPEALIAVTAKAQALRREDRYPSVAQFREEIDAYLGGFATKAEQAGLGKQLLLLIQRHHGIFATATAAWGLITALALWFVIDVTHAKKQAENERNLAAHERDRAESTLSDLRRTAPVFYAQAKVDFEEGTLAAALEKIGYAIQLDDTKADYRLFRANLRESSQDLAAAEEDYRRVLALRPGDAAAQTNLALCEKLRGEAGGAPLGKAQQSQLLTALREQKRLIEAAPLAAILDPDLALARSALLARLREARKLPGWKDDKGVIALPDGTFKVSLNGLAPIDFSVLQGQPVSGLDLGDTGLADLSSLAGLPLKELILTGARVTDLAPLRGMPLESLVLRNTPVSDLTPLRGMKLRTLNFYGTKVADLSPLAGMPLTNLDCGYCAQIKDLSPLHGAPLVTLRVEGAAAIDLAPLFGAPLKVLSMASTKSVDFTQLSQFGSLENLTLFALSATDLTPLAKMHLIFLDCRNTKIASLAPLRGQPLRRLNLINTDLTDLSPLADCTTLEEFLPPNAASDLTPLRHLPGLKRISTRHASRTGDPPTGADQPAEEFWKIYDAKRAALQAAGGWEDLFAQRTPAEVVRFGHGWSLKEGELFSPDVKNARLSLPCDLHGTSYQLRIKLRQLAAKEVFHVVLPVGDHLTGFELDGYAGHYTGLQLVDGKRGQDVPGILAGKQVKDSEPHVLEVTVRLAGANVTITTTLDTRALYEWTGPAAALSENPSWAISPPEPGVPALGTYTDNWAVSEVKVKRPEK